MITIFTPTYNRAYTLRRLYRSLLQQTSKDFVWLIVDDGSGDETEGLVRTWIDENKIEIEYYYQENAGKSSAHNKGVELSHTELFVCVDSDDYLVESAVQEVLEVWSKIEREEIIGILAFRGYEDGSELTKYSLSGETTGKLMNLYRKGIIVGDTMLIYRAELMKECCFPIFENEKFVPEAYLYDQLDEKGLLYVLPRVLYIGQYLDDGYTKHMAELIVDNPKGYYAWIRQRLEKDGKIKERCGDLIRYVSIAIRMNKKGIVAKSPYPMLTILVYPLGYLFYLIRYKKLIDKREKQR